MHNYAKRQKKVIRLLEAKGIDGLLIRKKQNISYLVGTRGEDAILFISSKKSVLTTDARYKEEYSKTIKNCSLKIAADLNITASKRIGFESNSFSYLEYINLKKKLKNISLSPVKGVIESLRIIKDEAEIRHIIKACNLGCEVMNYALHITCPNVSEESIRNNIAQFFTKKRIKQAGFEVIIASGIRASMPHASCSNRKIGRKDMVIIDLGALYLGYNSDLTRTVFLGRIERKSRRIYNVLLDAQKMAIEKIKPGVNANYIDSMSRQYISEKGLGKYFIHSLGHGIGLEVHEWPSISGKSNTVLQENMAITIEPGIYIPGWGGVRIEDVVLVTRRGCKVLTQGVKKCA